MPEHDIESTLSHVESRKVLKDCTVRWSGPIFQIEKAGIVAGLRDATVRVQQRRIGEVAIAFQGKFLASRQVSSPVRTALPAPKQTLARKTLGTAKSP